MNDAASRALADEIREWGACIPNGKSADPASAPVKVAVSDPQCRNTPTTLDPQPYVFVSDQVFGVRSAVDKGFHAISGAYYAFQPRREFEQDRSRYEQADANGSHQNCPGASGSMADPIRCICGDPVSDPRRRNGE